MGVKFHVKNQNHYIPVMFFPAYGKHMTLKSENFQNFGWNVILKYATNEP